MAFAKNCLVLAFALFALVTTGIPTKHIYGNSSGIANAGSAIVKFVPMTFVGPAVVGGADVILKGSYDEILSQLRTLNPSYDVVGPFSNSTLPSPDADNDAGLCADLHCGSRCPYPPASVPGIQDSINYLTGRIWGGKCHLPAGPGTCSRVSCSWSSAVIFCNDELVDIWVDCNRLGVYAQAAMDGCLSDPTRTVNYVNGQCFAATNKFNLIVGMDRC